MTTVRIRDRDDGGGRERGRVGFPYGPVNMTAQHASKSVPDEGL